LDIYVAHGSDRPLELPEEVLRSPFGAVVQRAVAKPLELRYRTAGQMLADVRAANDRLERPIPSGVHPDMEATMVVDPAREQQLSVPTEMSEKLREAFNVLAGKTEVTEVAGPLAPEDRPTLPREPPRSDTGIFDEVTADMAPAPQASLPIALVRPKKNGAAGSSVSEPAGDGGAPLEAPARTSSLPPPLPLHASSSPPRASGMPPTLLHSSSSPPLADDSA